MLFLLLTCCVSLKLKSPGVLCRVSSGSCDLPEYCDGKAESCPANYYLVDGTSCAGGQAFCYTGMCLTLEQQCRSLWGQGGWTGSRAGIYWMLFLCGIYWICCIVAEKLITGMNVEYLPWKEFMMVGKKDSNSGESVSNYSFNSRQLIIKGCYLKKITGFTWKRKVTISETAKNFFTQER